MGDPMEVEVSADGQTISLVGPSVTVRIPASAIDAFMAWQGLVIRRTFRTWLTDLAHGRWSA